MLTIRSLLLMLGLLTASAAEPITVAYFVQWGVYQRQYFVKNVETSGAAGRLDVLSYAFAKIGDDNRVALVDTHADLGRFHAADTSVDGEPDTWDAGALRGNFNQLRKLKARHPHLRVVIAIGGWTFSDRFSEMASSAAGREAFAQSCIEMFIKGRFAPGLEHPGIFDGIDIDWEYPGLPGSTANHRPEDTVNFTRLLMEMRARLDAQGALDGRRYTLSVALGASPGPLALVQLDAIHPHLDWLDLMAYDYHNATEERTNFQAALFGRPDDPTHAGKRWGDHAVQTLLSAGVPAKKIVLGVPFYGRGWQDVPPGADHGLFAVASGGAPATFEAGIEDYKVLKRLPTTFVEHRDPATASYWRYDPAARVFWTWDDPATIAAKRTYVQTNGLGGLMVWELSGDDHEGTLMCAVRPTAMVGAPSGNQAPTLAPLADHTTTAGTPIAIVLAVADDRTAAAALTLAAVPGNTALLPPGGVTFAGSGGSRLLRLTPTAGLTGTSLVTVTASDGVLSSSRTFTLTVAAPPPDRP